MTLVACPGCGTVLDRSANSSQTQISCFNCARRRIALAGLPGGSLTAALEKLAGSRTPAPEDEPVRPGPRRSWLILGILLAGVGMALALLTLRPRPAKVPAPTTLCGDWQLESVIVNGKEPTAVNGLDGFAALGAVWQFCQDGTLKWPRVLPNIGVLDARYFVSRGADPIRLRIKMKIDKIDKREGSDSSGDAASEGGEAETVVRKPIPREITLEWQGFFKVAADHLIICLAEPGVRRTSLEPGPGKLVLVYQRVGP